MDIDRLVGANLREVRKEAGLTQEELASRSGISTQHLSRVERAVCSATTQLLHRLAQALGVRMERFFEEKDIEAMLYIYTNIQ